MEKQIEEIKDCIDSVYGCDCAYYGVEGMAIAQALYNAGYRKQSEKYLIKENGDILPLTHHSEWISVEDRLPDKGQEVLAYRGDFDGDMMNTYTYLGSENWEDDYGYRVSTKHDGITHWMPLPEPPEMKGSE